jgi:ribonuclease HII
MPVEAFYDPDSNCVEIGIDEVGRGPMLGRVYSAAVILPKNNNFKHELMKDSKKFTSQKKIKATAQYIKDNCLRYSISYEDENVIDKQNIKNATHSAMHKAIKTIMTDELTDNYLLLVDGRDFKPLVWFDKFHQIIKEVPAVCIEGGDNKYSAIAAASILAKVERDNYIEELCKKYPKLDEFYDLAKNKGYGTAKHLAGINKYGITKWHRKTFGICKTSDIIEIE